MSAEHGHGGGGGALLENDLKIEETLGSIFAILFFAFILTELIGQKQSGGGGGHH